MDQKGETTNAARTGSPKKRREMSRPKERVLYLPNIVFFSVMSTEESN